MYTPTFDLTHKIINSLIKLELSLRDIKTTPLPSSTQKKIRDDMTAQNLKHVALLTGISISDDEAKNIAQGRVIPAPGSDQLVLSNYRSTSDFIYVTSKDPYSSLSSSLLLHLNKLLLNTAVESWEIGRFRAINDEVQSNYDSWTETAPDKISLSDPHKYYTYVLNWFAEKKHSIHPVLKTGCVLFEIFNEYPFVAGNQLTYLATGELLLERSGFSLHGLFPFARSISNSEPELVEAMINSRSKDADQTTWLEHFTKAISTEITSLRNDVIKATERKIYNRRKKMADLNSRQKKALQYLKYNHKLSRRKYIEMVGVSTMTAYRDLNELVEKKLLVSKGGGRSAHYTVPKTKEESMDDSGPKKEVVKVITDSETIQATSGENPVFSTLNEELVP